jgi:hypothetical protein
MKYILGIILLSILTLNTSCKQTSTQDTTKEIENKIESKYVVTPFNPSKSFEDAGISSMNYKDGTFTFGIAGESFKLGEQTSDAPQKMCANSGKGQHIHLIVDDSPYAAKYVSTFKHDITDGEHYLLAFLSRSYHESIKKPEAKIAQKISIANNSIVDANEIDGPMLFYSRPKGTYVGADTKRVMLDFYLVNCTLGDNYKVKANINGEEHILDSWQPYYVDGLPMGENTIELSLVDSEGNLAAVPLNPVSRTFTLKEDPAENAM